MTLPIDTLTDERPTARREFIGQIAASAIVLAGAACASPAATTAPAPTPSPTPPVPAVPVHWDDSWFAKLTAKHKAVFDSPAIEEGAALFNATGYIRGMHDAAGAGALDVQTVVVMRHAAVPMVFNDAMWAKYNIGAEAKVKDDSTGKWAKTNPFLGAPAASVSANGESAGTPPAARSPERMQPTLTWLAAHGHILLGCD
ncbi:MAG: hypothetical protein ABI442_05245, partial [Gemmatimonadaceae bacterium]